MGDTKTVPCSYDRCGGRRAHYERPEQERGRQTVDVPADFAGPAYCSLECAAYAGSKDAVMRAPGREDAMALKSDMLPGCFP